jgi:hypothetical protein
MRRRAPCAPRLFSVVVALTVAGCKGESTSPAPAPTKLAFTVQPRSVAAGVPLSPAVEVAVQDSLGNTVTTATNTVTVTITSGTGTTAANLRGTHERYRLQRPSQLPYAEHRQRWDELCAHRHCSRPS